MQDGVLASRSEWLAAAAFFIPPAAAAPRDHAARAAHSRKSRINSIYRPYRPG